VTPLLDVLREVGAKAIKDPNGTAAFLASKLGISESVMEKSEGRKQRYYAEPLDTAAISDQQAVADTFFRLGLIGKPLNVADVVFHSGP